MPPKKWLLGRAALCFALLCGCGIPEVIAQADPPPTNSVPATPTITLRRAIEQALLRNRDLQVERINPEIARLAINAAYGYYDPIFSAEGRRVSDSDLGGF